MSISSGWDDDLEILPDTSQDGSGSGWGDDLDSDDQRLVDERPPHWE